jgi:hypothetical protein
VDTVRVQAGSDEQDQDGQDPVVTWPKPAPPKKKTVMAMILYHAMRHQRKSIKERAAKINEYLQGHMAKQGAESLPLTVHIGDKLIYSKPVPRVFKSGEAICT